MEEYFRRVEFVGTTTSLQRRHSLSCQTTQEDEIRPIDAQRSGIHGRQKPRRRSDSSWLRPPAEEMPAMPEQAMEFLSRTWSKSSSDLLQILSPACTSRRLPGLLLGSASAPPEDSVPEDEVSKDEDGNEEKKTAVRLDPGRGQSLDERRVQGAVEEGLGHGTDTPCPPLSSRSRRMNKLTRPTWLNAWRMRAILRAFLLIAASSVAGGSHRRRRRRRRKDELRLHAAQAHAAVSVAQLAAAVAGMVSACELRWPAAAAAADEVVVDGSRTTTTTTTMGAVLASAAALVATVCAETAAESGRIDTARVASAVRAGRESRSAAELLALTATAATSLRGAAALELRAADVRGIGGGSGTNSAVAASLQNGATLRVCLPCGRVRVRIVAVFPHDAVVVLRLGTKLMLGAFITYKEYEVLAVSGGGGGDAVVEGRPLFPLALSTTGGATVQLLFEHQARCKVWRASVQGMLSEQKLKRPMN